MEVISLAADHAGYKLREKIKEYLISNGYEVIDHGTTNSTSVDFPDYSRLVIENIVDEKATCGILVCGTGIGMSMAANRVKGIRASVVSDVFSARATRKHNDSNVLCLGERVVGEGLALAIIEEWLNAEFEGGRHKSRVDKIEGMSPNE